MFTTKGTSKASAYFLFAVSVASGCGQGTMPESRGLALTTDVQTHIESHHPYGNLEDHSWEIRAPRAATSITIHFGRFETEVGYDYVYLYDSNAEDAEPVHEITGVHTGESFTIKGDYVRIRLVSDWLFTAWGFEITSYSYESDQEPEHPTDHRPYCGAVGSKSEGWYWGDTGELIKFEKCADLEEPYCGAIGSRSEGWFSNGEEPLIVWDNCHSTVGIAIEGESCGPSINRSCYDRLYCHGLIDASQEHPIGATGTCRRFGYCEKDSDCNDPDNSWTHIQCTGRAHCDAGSNQCVWTCGLPDESKWSWTSTLLDGVESDHPYDDDFTNTWTVTREGASKIKVHFSKIETEKVYDKLLITDKRGNVVALFTGEYKDVWSPEVDGDTISVTLITDYSITGWGFKADSVSYFKELPPGRCNTDQDCENSETCSVPICFNPYAECLGTCVEPQEVSCKSDSDCGPQRRCKQIGDNGIGTCRHELWCEEKTVEQDCAAVPHIMIPGSWACKDNKCTWQTAFVSGEFTNDNKMDIPDADPRGVKSEISVTDMLDCMVRAKLSLRIDHPYIGDLFVYLSDPSGRQVVVWDRQGGGEQDLVFEDVLLPEGIGRDGANGTWTLHAADLAYDDRGTLVRWSLGLECR